MLFNSFEFLLFFPAVVCLYFALPHRYRWVLLLCASYYFYACWRVEYLLLIVASTLVDYWAGVQMGRRAERRARRPFLVVSLVSNLGILFGFKYLNFFASSLQAVFAPVNVLQGAPLFDVLLPVGISFYTFQTLAYSIDVYRGDQVPERHLGIFALYVSFFPQLVAGPIERSTRLLPQFYEHHGFDYNQAVEGLRLMLWGFFKKLVVADRLAVYVNAVYGAPGGYEGWPVLVATYCFAFQIYCDFSGYTDIARGAAKVMGYDLMHNFRTPYFARSISDFWKRWHISLSTWFRDYLYIPLGGNRVGRRRWYANLVVVFVVSGLWHGANWTFVVWGLLHGLFLVASIVTAPARDAAWRGAERLLVPWATGYRAAGLTVASLGGLRRFVALVVTFHLVLLAWVFFRAATVGDAFVLLGSLLPLTGLAYVPEAALGARELFVGFVAVSCLLAVDRAVRQTGDVSDFLSRQRPVVRWGWYLGVVLFILFFGTFTEQTFIYFQF